MRTAENRTDIDRAALAEFVRRKAEVFAQCTHPLAGTGHRSALLGRLVWKQMDAELDAARIRGTS